MAAAVGRRAPLAAVTDAIRLVFGEADGLPGFVADRYGTQLVVQFQAAGVDARRATLVDALVRATSGDLFRYALWLTGQRALAEDLVQETYLRAWKALDELRDAQAAKPWLITILRREHARHHEKLGNRPATDLADVADQLAEETAAAPDADSDVLLLRRAIAQLKPKLRPVELSFHGHNDLGLYQSDFTF